MVRRVRYGRELGVRENFCARLSLNVVETLARSIHLVHGELPKRWTKRDQVPAHIGQTPIPPVAQRLVRR
jgi:hypothetical protein